MITIPMLVMSIGINNSFRSRGEWASGNKILEIYSIFKMTQDDPSQPTYLSDVGQDRVKWPTWIISLLFISLKYDSEHAGEVEPVQRRNLSEP